MEAHASTLSNGTAMRVMKINSITKLERISSPPDSVVDIANLSSLSCWRKYQFWGEAIDIDDHGNSSLWTSSFANEIAIAYHIGNLGALCSCPLCFIRFGHQLERFDICSPEAVWHSEVDFIFREHWFWSRRIVLWYLIERIHLTPTRLCNQPSCSSPGGRRHSAINVTLTEKLIFVHK